VCPCRPRGSYLMVRLPLPDNEPPARLPDSVSTTRRQSHDTPPTSQPGDVRAAHTDELSSTPTLFARGPAQFTNDMANTPWEEQRHTSSHGIHKATRQLCGPTGYCARSDRLTGQCITHWVLRVRGLHVANGDHRHWLNWPSHQPDRRHPKCPLLSLCQRGCKSEARR